MITHVDDGDRDYDLWKIGPIIIFSALGEVYVTLQIAWLQDGSSAGVLTWWSIDTGAESTQYANLDWNEYWQSFLDLLAEGFATRYPDVSRAMILDMIQRTRKAMRECSAHPNETPPPSMEILEIKRCIDRYREDVLGKTEPEPPAPKKEIIHVGR